MTRLSQARPGRSRGVRHDAQADLARAGEGDEVHLGVGDQRLADLAAGAEEQVQRAGGRAGGPQDAGQLRADHAASVRPA